MNPATAQTPRSSAEADYDEVPYPSYPERLSHPDNLATIGGILGIDTAAVETCRVLELGCASGGNIVPMAAGLPGAEFVGIDISSRQIAEAQRQADALGLENLRLIHGSFADINAELGDFDYIVSHGVLSWVPAEAREFVYAVSKQNLAPNGIAYISYNTYPGWHMPNMLREMMQYHTASFEKPSEKIEQGRALLEFLAVATGGNDDAFAKLVQSERDLLAAMPDYYVYHDNLEATNSALYFHQFVEACGRHGLQYVSDAQISRIWLNNFPPDVAKVLQQFGDANQTEQYIDFVLNRRFRQSLVCHADAPLNRVVNPDAVEGYAITAKLESGDLAANLFNDKTVEVAFPGGAEVTIGGPATKLALHLLSAAHPRALGYEALIDAMVDCARDAGETLAEVMAERTPAVRNALAKDLLQLYFGGVIRLHRAVPAVATGVGERPLASPLARLQAAEQDWVVNQWHVRTLLTPTRRAVLQRLDGEKTRAEIEAVVGKALAADEPIENALQALAEFGLLVE